jgi:putative component of toxin-antitoxin plasmid stabilization module
MRHGAILVVLLSGGDKGSQRRDIVEAKRLAGDWKEHDQ